MHGDRPLTPCCGCHREEFQRVDSCDLTGSYKCQVRPTVIFIFSFCLHQNKIAGRASHIVSYFNIRTCDIFFVVSIALVTEIMRHQQKNMIPSEVTAKDMCELLVEESKGVQ